MPLASFVLPAFGLILGPLIWWVLMKDKSPAAREHGGEVLNFAISYFIYITISTLLAFVLIGIPLLILLSVAMIVFIIIGTIQASDGKLYRYPLIIRFIK